MEKALAIQKEVQKILGTEECFLIGGATRDLVMGNTPKDYDFATPMLPDDMVLAIKKAGRRVYDVGQHYGTIGMKVPVPINVIDVVTGAENMTSSSDQLFMHYGYEYVEITTYRGDKYSNNSRKPEVTFTTNLDEDLKRRDIRFNAMALMNDGKIYDPLGGKLDIYKKQIVSVGLPKERITEDPLRIFRAARFAARYNFTIDHNFIGKARQLADRIFDVSVERWCAEMDKLLISEHPNIGLRYLTEMRIIQRMLPEFNRNALMPSHFSKSPDEAWSALLNANIDGIFSSDICNKFGLAPDKAKRFILIGICARFKFSNDRTKIILGDKK